MEIMKIGDLSFSILLRFFSPLIIYLYIYISNPSQATRWIKYLTDKFVYLGNIEAESSLLLGSCIFLIFISSVVLGSIIFLFYRNFWYELVIRKIQDCLRLRLKSKNQRTYLQNKFGITKTQSMLVWNQIRTKYLEKHYTEMMEIYGSNIHMLYLSGFIAIVFFVFSVVFDLEGMQYALSESWILNSKILILILGIILSFIGGVADWNYETRELASLCSIYGSEIENFTLKIINCAGWTSNTWWERFKKWAGLILLISLIALIIYHFIIKPDTLLTILDR